ncbi:hypothetical protein F4861DRAFT_539495, partial [Xylaria intraflava]
PFARAEKGSRPQTLQQYLEACHSLSLAIRVETNQALTTQGSTTDPVGRVFPRRIVPWDEYPTHQENIWGLLDDLSFCSDALFPSSHQLEYVATLNRYITSEIDLRHFARDTVEIAVQKLFDAAVGDDQLRARLDLEGSVTFENHTNREADVDPITQDDIYTTPPARKWPRKAKMGRAGPVDQYCVYQKYNGQNIPALAIEYKAPHKLTRDEVVDEVDGNGFTFASRALVAAVITQLFAYMVDKCIYYGYVYTGETCVFLHIPDDPFGVYYYVCVPNMDVLEDDKDRLHHTFVAQVFAFVLLELRSPPPPLTWHDRAEDLDTWAVEFEDVLRGIPITDRQPTKNPPLTRGRHDSDSDNEGDPPSPSVSRVLLSSTKASTSTSTVQTRSGHRGRGRASDEKKGGTSKGTRTRIVDRPFCTQTCLSGLASGGLTDEQCPNFKDHPRQHISLPEFRRLMRLQLAEDRGPDADAMPLYLSGSVGALFEVRLSSHGYTLVAKGVEEEHVARLQHENHVYDRLRTIQGQHVPVCLGMMDLVLPYYYNGGVFVYFLFLAWAGRLLPRQTTDGVMVSKVSKAFKAIHMCKVLHCDAEPRNVLYDAHTGRFMVVDFERAKLIGREPLGMMSPNRKRKHSTAKKQKKDDFEEELSSVVSSMQRYR